MKSFKGYRWRYLYKEIEPKEELRKRYPYPLAQLLANRGFEEPPIREKVGSVLSGLPFLEEAFSLILSYGKRNKPILLFGDYDADGITSTALLYKTLKRLGFKRVYPVVPERDSGYGITPKVVEGFYKFTNGEGGLIVALDNGTKEVETVKRARELGLEVVIFDHHTPGEELPPVALVNPKIEEKTPQYLKDLSTVGLVFLFAKSLEREGYPVGANDFVDLAALGTVADVSPLSPINARIVKAGLKKLNDGKTSSLGLKVLLQKLNLKQVGENDIAFRIAPRLNVFGRMKRAKDGLEFLITESEEKASKLYGEMETINRLKKIYTKRATEKVLKVAQREGADRVVYADREFPKGILGIVASRVTSILGGPSVIFYHDEKNNILVGSARSPEGVNIVKVLEKLSHLLERWGGHSQAAGLSLRPENFPSFKERLLKELEKYPIEPPTLNIDLPLSPKKLKSNPLLVEILKMLEPFGAGNPYPTFVFEDILLNFWKTKYGYGLLFKENGQFYLNTESEKQILPSYYKGKRVRVVYTVRNLNNLQLQVEDLLPLN